jgi:hypothetical protein
MKKQFFILCFVFLATVSYTQNYQLIQPAQEQHFLFVNTINTGPNYQREIRSIRIDSIATQGTETHYYNYKILEENSSTLSCAAQHSDSSWLGHQVIQSNNGTYVFFNQALDSIIIQSLAPINNTWVLYEFGNGDYIEATVTSIDTATILGNIDSVKTLNLQVKDVANNLLTHPMNSEILQFSKQNGWIQFFNFHEFPNNTIPYNLVGSSAQPNIGISSPTQANIFDFNVGDEIHTAGEYRMQFAQWQYGQHRQIKTILSKDVSANQDTIAYTYERCLARINNDGMAGTTDTSYTTDTVTQQIVLSETSNLDQLTHELFPDSMGYSLTSIRNFASDRRQKVTYNHYYYDDFYACWTLYLDVWPRIWIEGLGGPFQNGFYRTDMPVYYKKGTETWGTPIDCSTFLGIDVVSAANSSVKVFPNPFTETTTVQIEDFNVSDNWSIELVDITGKVVRSADIHAAPFTLSKRDLVAGVYFYRVRNAVERVQFSGKLVLL